REGNKKLFIKFGGNKMLLVENKNDRSILAKESLEKLGAKNVKIYNMDTGSNVIYSVENGKEHLTISNEKRFPNWNEIKYVRYKLMKPNKTIVQILPPKEEYINLHENCFHLWEIEDNAVPTK
ncbi:DUF1827 family protein, partial [Clostridioides difficile]|nr:DUF1827 family protein [Clostridioides difficile]